jgi:nucleoid-associated protein YgaU
MLRKDVKLGFAIGGIMLAVVVVYVLVVPSGDKKTVGLVTDDTPSGKTDATPTPDGLAPDGKAAEPLIADKTNAPPADPTKADASSTPATMPSAASNAGTTATPSGGPDWNKLLAEGSSSPTMMSETPTAAPKGSDVQAATPPPDASAAPTPSADQPAAPAVADSTAAAADKTTPDLAIDTAASPATRPSASGQQTHIVQPGETLTAISEATFGTSRKWKLIAEANPNINPYRLAPGTKLVIPAASTAAAATIDASSAELASSKIDSTTQYEVQPSDSLYRISMKLYGKPDHVDKLYQDNKDVIGADPRRLKLHEVLKLTDPPTTAAR